jgi:hypothetical protein
MQDEIRTYAKTLTEQMQKMLDANDKVLAILSNERPEVADVVIKDINDALRAMKNNDLDKINQIYERYANHITK